MSSVQSYRTLYPSAARTATPSAVTQDEGSRSSVGGHFILDVTAIVSAPSITVNIEAFDPASGKWYAMLTSAAITAVSTTVLRVYPGVTPTANLSVSDGLPSQWRARVTHGNSDSITYSLGVRLLD